MTRQFIKTIGATVFIFAILISALFILSFDIGKRVDDIERIRGELYFNSKSINNLAVLQSDFNKIQPYFSDVDNFLPTRDKFINFKKDAGNIALQNNISFSSNFSAENSDKSGNLNYIGLSIVIDGPFDNIINFLKALEGSRYSIKYDSLDLYSKTKDFRANLIGKAFYFN